MQENAAICDQVAEIQENIIRVKDERKFLLQKLVDSNPDLLAEELKNGNLQLANSNGNGTAPTTRRPYKKRAKKWALENGEQKPKIEPHTSLAIDQSTLKVLNVGRVVADWPQFHDESHIYPLGYEVTRVYAHVKDPERKCVYTCRITNDAETPIFQIASENQSELLINGPTPDFCHTVLLQMISQNSIIRNIEFISDGDYFFGLSHPAVAASLQALPDLNKCVHFKAFVADPIRIDKETNPSINYDALQKHIAMSSYHTVLEVKEEPPDELF